MPSLIDRLRGRASQSAPGATLRVGSGGQFLSTQMTWARVANSVLGNPTGYRCVEMIASAFSRPDWAVRKPGTEDLIEVHPLLGVLNAPDPFSSGTMLQARLIRDLEVSGRSTWLKMQGRDGFGDKGPVTGLRRLAANRVTVVGNADDELIGFVYSDRAGARQAALPEDVVYVRYPNPDRDYDGIAPALAGVLGAETDSGAARFNYDLLANDGALPGYVSVDGLSGDQFREWKAAWESGEYPGKTRFLGGKASYVRIGQSNQELAYDALRTMSQKDVCRAFGVPFVLLEPTDATFANMGEAKSTWINESIAPKWRLVSDELTIQLGRDFGVEVAFKLDDIDELNEAQDSVVARGVQLLDRQAVTINEFRADLGFDPVPWGDTPVQPVGPMKMESAAPAGGETPPAADDVPPTPLSVPDPPPAGEPGPGKSLSSGVVKGRGTTSSASGGDYNRRVARHAARYERSMAAYFLRQGRVASARVRAQAGKSLAKAAASPLDAGRWDAELSADLTNLYGGTVDDFGAATSEQVGGAPFDPAAESVTAAIAKRAAAHAAEINATTSDALDGLLADGADDGMTAEEMATAADDYFATASTGRASTIAMTEAVGAATLGILSAAAASNVCTGKRWLSDGTLDQCAEYEDLGEIALDDSFDGLDGPPAHPNCRCWVAVVSQDLEEI